MTQARHTAGHSLGRAIVDADRSAPGPLLPLLSYRRSQVSDLANTQAIQVRTANPASDPAMPFISVETTRFDGQPLLGSIDDISGEVQLATEAVVVLDMNGGPLANLHTVATRVLDPAGEFMATEGPGLSAQLAHHLLHGWYAEVDTHLTDPLSGTKRWDSAYPVYFMPPGTPSPTPPGTFAPRMLAFVNAVGADCKSASAVACASPNGYGIDSLEGLSFPEVVHSPMGASGPEVTGHILMPPPGTDMTTLTHEFGHLVDLFVGPGITADIAPECGGACVSECIEDTSDEAIPLAETIPQLVGMVMWSLGFPVADFEYCGIIDAFSRNGSKPWDPGACLPPGEDTSEFSRPGACSKPSAYCDKPMDPGFWLECCDPAIDANCIVVAPADCPTTGFQRQVPTGLCHSSPGYDTHSVMQAWWQLLNGRQCDPADPLDCQSVTWPLGLEPAEAMLPALLYSLRLDPLTYQQLFDGMASYIACTYGPSAYDQFNAVACAHGLRDCAEPIPVVCETCGNGVREGSEACDGMDWAMIGCADLPPFTDGTLLCDPETCQFDSSQCLEGGLDTTMGLEDTTVGSDGASETSSAGSTDGGGCGCRSNEDSPMGRLGPLALLFGLGRRRTRNLR